MLSKEEKKEYLRSYRAAQKEVEILEEAIKGLRDQEINPALRQPDGMPKGSGFHDLSDYAARLDGLEREWQAKKWEAVDRYHRVMTDILAISDETERRLLQYRYINGYTWEQIADSMMYSYRWILKLHGRALEHLRVSEKCSL
ncbi:MAG: hypothetical protein HFI93_05750 [Lachnospiraceae bacterium]|nr:hypothetical protein [Lachnospiraceae bacterium]